MEKTSHRLAINLDHDDWECVKTIMDELHISKPNKLIRFLISQEYAKNVKQRIREQKKLLALMAPKKEKRLSRQERRRMLEQLPEQSLLEKLKPLICEEFGCDENDKIAIEKNPATGGISLNMVIYSKSGPGSVTESGIDLRYYLNQWEKSNKLDNVEL